MNAARSVLFAAVVAAALAPSALAEEVVLRSGTRYDATNVVLLPGEPPGTGRVRFSFAIGAGRGTVELPYDRLDPVNLYGLAIARTDPKDPRGQLALAQFARDRGLLGEAETRYRRAAAMDPALVPDRDAGLAAVATQRAEAALLAAEAEVKRGRSDLALPRIEEVLATAPAGSSIAERARGLRALASKVVQRDLARRAAEDAARAAAAADAAAATLASSLHRADQALEGAAKERARVADPNLSAATAQQALETAETRLREARRQLALARSVAGAPRDDVEARDRDAFALLVATDLDLAELHRQGRRFDRARDYLRAAQVLDPENPRIKEIHDRIEQDLRTPPPQEPEPRPSPWWYGPGTPYGPYVPYAPYRAPSRGTATTFSYFRGRWNGFRVVFGW
jgi:tetratricopeptide (TPR) repeat protein